MSGIARCKTSLRLSVQQRPPKLYSSHTCKRWLSSPALATPNGVSRRSTETTVTPRVAARNVLKSLLDLLPRTLPMESRRLWDQHASSAFDELESGKSRLIRIAIWGDEASGAGEVVTSLLDDPLSNDSNQRNMLHQRWGFDSPHGGTIRIRNSDSISRDGTYLNLKSNWLERLNAEIIECRGLDPFPTLLSSDHVILVTDNIRLLDAPGLRNLLRTLSHAPSVHILVAERAPRAVYSLTQLDGTSPTVVKPDYAVQGLSAFGKGDINGYQKFLIESKIPQLAQQISRKCSELGAPSSPSSSTSLSVVRTAAHIARATLAACEAAINDAQAALTSTAAPLSQFKTKISTVYPDAYQSALRGTVTVREGVAAAEQRVRAAFGRLPWYSLWWRADEVSGTLSEAISWGSLGTQLAFHAGRLSSIRQQLYDQAVALATPSPVLTNKLAQIDARTPVGPDALSTPLMQRTAQLLAPGGPVEDVHRRAQAAVMTTAVSILGSGAIATGLFAIGSVGAGTTVGLGLLGSVLSIRWMQSAWARAEKRWWADWARVCAGLERDCEVALKEMVRERVTVSALAGIEGMETIVTRRAEIISALKKEAQGLEEQLVVLEQRLK